MWLYHTGVELTITNYKFLYKVNDVRKASLRSPVSVTENLAKSRESGYD
jgi:hypothetical protein